MPKGVLNRLTNSTPIACSDISLLVRSGFTNFARSVAVGDGPGTLVLKVCSSTSCIPTTGVVYEFKPP